MNIKGISTAASLLAITETLSKYTGELTKADKALASELCGGSREVRLLKHSNVFGLRSVKKSGAEVLTINKVIHFDSEALAREYLENHFTLVPQYSGATDHVVEENNLSTAGFNSCKSGHIGFHNDAYDYKDLPSYLALYCCKSDCTGGETFLAKFDTAFQTLTASEKAILLSETITFQTDPASHFGTKSAGVTQNILDRGVLRYSDGYIRQRISEKSFIGVLNKINCTLHENKKTVKLRPGDLLIIDNQSFVHGRNEYSGSRKLVRFWMNKKGSIDPGNSAQVAEVSSTCSGPST